MKYILISALVLLTSCGEYVQRSELIPGPVGSVGASGLQGNSGTNGLNSLVSTARFTSSTLVCVAGSGVLVNSGLDLNNDNTLENTEVTSTTVLCDGANGAVGPQGPSGHAGSNGTNGSNGSNGSNGVSCTVSQIVPSSTAPAGGALLQCGVTQVVVYNGSTNAASQMFSVVQEIKPCGSASSPWKEVLLQLAGGSLIGDFSANSSALSVRLSDIPDGNYVDTDESGCNFNVSTSSSTRSISWSAGHNAYSTWTAQVISWPVY